MLSKPGQKRYAIGPFECYYIHLHLDPTDELKRDIDRLPDWCMPKEQKLITDIFTSVCDREFSRDTNAQMYVKGAVMQLIAQLNEMLYPFGSPQVHKFERYFENIIAAKNYLDVNYGTKLNLKTAAAISNLSPNFFRTVFSDTVGVSPHEYLIALRIKKAQEYLINTDFSISGIAESCGFETQSYMNNVFISRVGITPYKYRKQYRKEI